MIVLALFGVALVVTAAALVFVPAGLAVAGVACMGIAYLIAEERDT